MRAEREKPVASAAYLRGPWAWVFASVLLTLSLYFFWVNAGREMALRALQAAICQAVQGCLPPELVPPPRALWAVTSVVLRVTGTYNGVREVTEKRIDEPLQVEAIVAQAARLRRAPYQYAVLIKPSDCGVALRFYAGEHPLTTLVVRPNAAREKGPRRIDQNHYLYRFAEEEYVRLNELIAPGQELRGCPEQPGGN